MTSRLRNVACALASVAVTVGAWTSGPASAATPAEVDKAVERARDYLLSQMKDNNWEVVPARVKEEKGIRIPRASVSAWQWGGLSGIATYGVLAAGVKPSDQRLSPAIDWLAKAQIQGHYASGFRAQVWPFLQEKPAKLNSAADFRLLLNGMHPEGAMRGFYPYYTTPVGEGKNDSDLDPRTSPGTRQPDWFDRSVSQIAVLGMWACEQAGQEVPSLYWQVVDAAWKKSQKPDGGWSYDDKSTFNGAGQPTATMTAAGVATLYITQDYMLQSQKWDVCKGGVRNEWIERGLGWIDRNAASILGGKVPHPMYALYGVERIGVASGRKYFGTTDWYKVGAEYIVKRQNKDGSWGTEDEIHNPKKVPDTVFATLFLVRGRAPVIMSKLEYHNGNEPAALGPPPSTQPGEKPAARPPARTATAGKAAQPDPWNERPRDAANFAHWASKQTERYLNWQIVNLKVPSSELHDAPILYIAGSEALVFNDEEVAKLRAFVEEGGLILGNADCGNANFTKSFIALGQKLFPKYEFRELQANHSIYVDQQYKPAKWRSKPRVDGLSNGVRELMVLIPIADPARAWQTRSDKTRNELYELMQNIFLYSVDKANLRARGETYVVEADPKAKAAGSLQVARVIHGDNPDPEPGGWRRLSAVLLNDHKLKVTVREAKLGEGKLAGAQLAHWTGTTKVTLNPQQQAELKAFVAAGGTLLVDAAGGSGDFAASADAALAQVFGATPGNLGKILPPDADVWNQANAKVERFGYRTFAKGKIGGLNAPRVRALEVGGRKAVFFSGEDLTAGMVGQPVDGILGYTPDTATDIARNVALYAAANGGKGGAKPVAAKGDASAKTD